jgi:peptidyl-prolyl cis-trans isomerase C
MIRKEVFVLTKRGLVLWTVLIVFTLGTLTGCGSLSQYFGGKWAAKVNGEKISIDDFNKRIDKTKKYYEQQGMDFSGEQGKPMLDQIKKQTLDDMITEQLLLGEAKKQNLLADDAKVNTELDSIKKNFPDDAKYQEALKNNDMTEPDLKVYLKNELSSKALYDKVTADVTVSDADVKNEYDKNKDQYSEQEQVKARHILVATEDEAKAIITQLKGGAKFIDLAKEKSTEPGAKDSGGDLGYFTKGQMDPAFEKAAFEQKPGTFSEKPVKSQFGYHVILVEDHKAQVQKTFDQVKEDIKKNLPQAKKDEKFKQYLDDLKKNSKIEYSSEFKALDTTKK